MHPIETHTKFIELRAQGYSQRGVAEQLGIDRSTAQEWDHKHREEIQIGRADRIAALQEQWLPADEELLLRLLQDLDSINTELCNRDYRNEPTSVLIRRQSMLLARLDKLRLKAQGVPLTQKPEPPGSQ